MLMTMTSLFLDDSCITNGVFTRKFVAGILVKHILVYVPGLREIKHVTMVRCGSMICRDTPSRYAVSTSK